MSKELKSYKQVREKIEDNKKLFDTERHLLSKPVREAVDSTFDICKFLVDKVEELDNKISKNSRNSSKAPSTDNKDEIKPNQSLREKSERKSGGQNGRKGSFLKRVETPDQVISHKPKENCSCGKSLKKLNLELISQRQVFEIEFKKTVVEHQQFKVTCTCSKEHFGEFPEEVKAHTQYGKSVRAVVNYLSKYQLIPSGRLKELFSDLFGIEVSEGSIDNFSNYGQDSLDVFKKLFFEHVNFIKAANVDETTTRVNGKRGHLHVFSNEYMTYIYYHLKRGMEAVNDCGLLSKFNGTLIHDCFSMYFNYGKDHAICNAHLLRELTFIEEKYNLKWAHQIKVFLNDLNQLVKEDNQLSTPLLDSVAKDLLRDDFFRLLDLGRIECEPLIKKTKNKGRVRGKQHVALNLINRLIRLRSDILRFMYNDEIPFTNNQAERDLRMTKVHLKISGGFRSERGAKNYALFRSYISTVKKHGLSVFEALKNLHNPYDNPTLGMIFKPIRPE
jgi:transposase